LTQTDFTSYLFAASAVKNEKRERLLRQWRIGAKHK